MTTFQDPPPQSRRAVRQSERGDLRESPESPTGFAQFPPVQGAPAAYSQPSGPASPPYFPDATAARDLWDTTARRAAQLPQPTSYQGSPGSPVQSQQTPSQPAPNQPAQSQSTPQSGRRAAAAPAPAPTPSPSAPPAGEPLSYSTQAPLPPQYAPQQKAWQQSAPQQVSSQQATPPQAAPRSAEPQTAEPQTAYPPQWTPSQQPPQSAGEQFASTPPAAQPAAPSLRPRQEARRAQETAQPVPAPQPTPQAFEQPAYRPRDFSPEGRRAVQPEPAGWTLASPATPSELEYQTQARGAYDQYQQSAANPYLAQPQVAQPPIAQAPVAAPSSQPVQQTLSRRELRALLEQQGGATEVDQFAGDPFGAGSAVEPTAIAPAAVASTPAVTLTTGSRPVGHWSTQAAMDDPNEVHETTLSRVIGSGHTATNALVLPETPSLDIRGPLTGTGEIMLTGSIELPHTLSSTGATDRIDHGGIDALFDANDREVSMADSAPIRALSAVSTHTSARGIQMHKPKGRGVMTLLIVAAGVLVVGVAGLLVAAFVFKLI